MARTLQDILKAANDTIKGVRPSTTTDLSLGKDPGVDYDPKAKDEQDFVAKHSVQKFDDVNGNGADVFQATNVKHSQVSHAHGYKAPKDKKVNEESFDEAWIVTHKDGKVTTHAGQKDAMSASKKSPGSKVSATHGAMGQKAHDVLSPHQRSNMGTFSAAGYTPPEKKNKLKEDDNIDKVNAVANALKTMASQPIKPMGQSNTSSSSLPKVNAPGAPDMFKEKKKVKEEVEELDEMPTQYRSTAGMGSKRGWASAKAAKVAFQNPHPLREPGTKKADKEFLDKAQAEFRARGGKPTQLPPGRAKGVRKEEVEQIDEISAMKGIKTAVKRQTAAYGAAIDRGDELSDREQHKVNRSQALIKKKYGEKGDKIVSKAVGKKIGYQGEEVEQVDEVLTKKDPASTWIRDFIKSKDPKFAGKSKEKRKEMALAAYYAKQRNEEVELDEAVQVKKNNYSWGKMITVHDGASHSFPLHPEHQKLIANLNHGQSTSFKDETNAKIKAHRDGDKIHLKHPGSNATTTVDRHHFTEEVELDEVSKKTLGSYIKKASSDMARQREKRVDTSGTRTDQDKAHNKEFNRKFGIRTAVDKLTKESLAVPLLGGDMDDESAEMAKAQLKALAAKANALADQLSDDLMIEPWVQSKIAVAKDYVTSVHDYMIYGEHDKNNEQTGPDTPMTFPGMSVDVNTGRNV